MIECLSLPTKQTDKFVLIKHRSTFRDKVRRLLRLCSSDNDHHLPIVVGGRLRFDTEFEVKNWTLPLGQKMPTLVSGNICMYGVMALKQEGSVFTCVADYWEKI